MQAHAEGGVLEGKTLPPTSISGSAHTSVSSHRAVMLAELSFKVTLHDGPPLKLPVQAVLIIMSK